MITRTNNLHVAEIVRFTPPAEIIKSLPMSEAANATVVRGRQAIEDVLCGKDTRLLMVVGPCSIHDRHVALEYASRLVALAREVENRILIVMRVYFEKPRTTIGWKGLLNDPHINGQFDIDAGLRLAREIALRINELGMPIGTEMLDPITPQYLADLVTWASIGARTTESQTHRQMASGLSMPVGFKNGTDGSLDIAVNAMLAAQAPHVFLGIDADGHASVVRTTGNPWGHLILRGGRERPNYHEEDIEDAVQKLNMAGLGAAVMVDCSHANSRYEPKRQERVLLDSVRQRVEGGARIMGLMLESNLVEGNQKVNIGESPLRYGISITDACLGWEDTERLIRQTCRILG
jgi:3-deoxy-7-phosphoheptulonate synthase